MLTVLVPNHLVIQILLPTTHRAADYQLRLLWQLGLHVFLEPSQEERAQHSMQFLKNFLADGKVFFESLLERNVEPLIKVFEGIKNLGHQEMQE